MLFNSLQFCAFFVIVTTAYYLLPWRRRWQMLLAASCFFYMSFVPAYILILLVTIALDYYMGLRIADSTGERRRIYLWVSIVSTCLVLFVFKHYNFFVAASTSAGRLLGMRSTLPLSSLILPIGLSFHTFQSLSYVVEVYRGRNGTSASTRCMSCFIRSWWRARSSVRRICCTSSTRTIPSE